jgi:large subunit ribosomal protein L17
VRHARAGKKLGRDSAHRKALYSNLAGALITHGRIKTTEAKAKAVKPFAERLITLGKRGDLHARRKALAELRSQDVVHELFAEVAPRFAERPGGYTRIVKLGQRQATRPRWCTSSSSTTSPRTRWSEPCNSLLLGRRRAGFGERGLVTVCY